MMFQKKVERAMKWLRDKNKSNENDENIELEKKDILAIIISGLIVFLPLIIILILLLFLLL